MLDERRPVGAKVEGKPLRRAIERKRLRCKNAHDDEERKHHPLGDALHPASDPDRANAGRHGHGDEHENEARAPVGDERSKFRRGSRESVGARERKKPPRDVGVVDHEEEVARENHKADAPPRLSAEKAEGTDDARAAAPSHRKLRKKDGEAEKREKREIDEHKRRAAVLPDDERKAPDVPEAHGASRRKHQKAKPARQFLPHVIQPPAACSSGRGRRSS